MALLFEWDNEKAINNVKKHGVTFDEAISVFYDTFALISLYQVAFKDTFKDVISKRSEKSHKSLLPQSLRFLTSFRNDRQSYFIFKSNLVLDVEHSITEERFSIIGYSKSNRILFISYTETNEIIRIISARKTTKNERLFYEKNIKNN